MTRMSNKSMKISRMLWNEEKYREMPVHAKWMYIVLKEVESRKADSCGFFLCGYDELADLAGMCSTTTQHAVKALVNIGAIEVISGGIGKGVKNKYRFIDNL